MTLLYFSEVEEGGDNAESRNKNHRNLANRVLLHVLFGIFYCRRLERLSYFLRLETIAFFIRVGAKNSILSIQTVDRPIFRMKLLYLLTAQAPGIEMRFGLIINKFDHAIDVFT